MFDDRFLDTSVNSVYNAYTQYTVNSLFKGELARMPMNKPHTKHAFETRSARIQRRTAGLLLDTSLDTIFDILQ